MELPDFCRNCGSTLLEKKQDAKGVLTTCLQCRDTVLDENAVMEQPGCRTCGGTRAADSEYCRDCLDARQAIAPRKLLCVKCHRNESEPRQLHCRECLAEYKDSNTKQGRQRGQCEHCSKDALPGLKHCANCSNKSKRKSAGWRNRNIQEGRCSRCGGEREDPEFRTCRTCRSNISRDKKAHRENRKAQAGPEQQVETDSSA